jgi:E3 ubiquitin-protein ligase UBR1
VVKIETDVQQLLTTASLINQIDLGVTARRVHDYFREQIVAVVVEWLLDLTQSRLMSDNIVIREIIGSELLAQRKKDSSSLTTSPEASKVYAEIKDPARMDWLFLYHTRLWKKPRLSLKQVYLSVLTLSHEHKLAVGEREIKLSSTTITDLAILATHFANVYHRIIDSYLLVDREPENSIKYFALRLFTVPSIAHHIVRHHNVVFRLLDIITSFFTNQISQKRMIFPPAPKGIVDIESPPFKSKRFMPVFSDLRFICSNDSVQTLIAHNAEFIVAFIKLCHLFMGINPNKRAATAHVEYETEAWISVFNVTVSLSRVVKVFGEAFAKGKPGDLLSSIARVMHSILTVCTLMDDRLDRAKYQPINFHHVTFNNTTFEVVEFDVASGWISFHHSLHWLLAELFKHIDLLTPEYLMPLVGGSGTLRDIVKDFGVKAVLTMIDFPLRGMLFSLVWSFQLLIDHQSLL